MERIGLRAAGRLAGCDHAHIARLAGSGQLPRGEDGLFDPADVLRVKAQADPGLVRKPPPKGGDKVVTRSPKSPRGHRSPPNPVTTPADAVDAVALVARVLAEEGIASDGPPDIQMARLCEVILKSRDRSLRIDERKKTLVSLDAVKRHVSGAFVGFRQTVQRMPSRHVPEMSARLGVDPGLLQTELDRMIAGTLTEMSAPIVRG